MNKISLMITSLLLASVSFATTGDTPGQAERKYGKGKKYIDTAVPKSEAFIYSYKDWSILQTYVSRTAIKTKYCRNKSPFQINTAELQAILSAEGKGALWKENNELDKNPLTSRLLAINTKKWICDNGKIAVLRSNMSLVVQSPELDGYIEAMKNKAEAERLQNIPTF
jgi:hypothetical protein